MNENSTLYWSTLRKYEDCPQNFLWSKGWGNIDLGYGPGKGIPVPEKRSEHHAMMGTVIQAVIEKMYNDELYRDPARLSIVMQDLVDVYWAKECARRYLNVREAGMSEEEMIQTCKDGVAGFLRTMKQHRLLGNYAKAEVDLIGWVDKYLKVGGRADTIIRRDDTGITILDGKNTKRKASDPDQLRWYALVFKLSFKQLPDRLGFVYYRHPYGEEYVDPKTWEKAIEQGVEWVDFTEEDLKGLALRAQQARNGMRKEKFHPNPSPKNCQWCEYVSICKERQEQIRENAGNRSKKKEIEALSGAGGFIDLD